MKGPNGSKRTKVLYKGTFFSSKSSYYRTCSGDFKTTLDFILSIISYYNLL